MGNLFIYKVALYQKLNEVKIFNFFFFFIEGWKHVDVERPLSLELLFSGDLLIFWDEGN